MNFNRGCFSKIYSDPAFYYTALFNNFPDAEFTKLVCKVFLKKKIVREFKWTGLIMKTGAKNPELGGCKTLIFVR